MQKLHDPPSAGTKYIIKPCAEITSIGDTNIIMTPYYGKTLRHYRNHHWKGDEEKVKRLARGLLLGLKHMHECGYAHRDIKADNILLQNAEGDPVIIDFGLVNDQNLQSGTPDYTAPE